MDEGGNGPEPYWVMKAVYSCESGWSFFQRSMANTVLAGYVTRICEIYIDDVLINGTTDNEYLDNTRKVLTRLRLVCRKRANMVRTNDLEGVQRCRCEIFTDMESLPAA